jgi:hypothetical protein
MALMKPDEINAINPIIINNKEASQFKNSFSWFTENNNGESMGLLFFY